MKILLCLTSLVFFSLAGFGQIQTAGSYLDVTTAATGGAIAPGDILEIHAVISVPSGTSLTSLYYTDVVPAGTTYIANSLKVVTNEGVVVGAIPNTGTYTDVAADDRGQNVLGNITIYMGTGATSAAGGSVTGGTTTPVFYSVASILMAAYRVQVSSVTGSTITLGGVYHYTVASAQQITLATTTISIQPVETCGSPNITNMVTDETNGTFGSGTTLNRAAALTTATGFANTGLTTGQPSDGYYSIVKTTSPTQYTGASPAGSDKVFTVWDIVGDHSGTANGAGNAAPSSGASGGYMLAVNASFAPATAFKTTIGGIVAGTNYTLGFWMRNICPNCGANPAANASSGTPGVKPNISFNINGNDVYNTGEITYNGQWIQRSFTFGSGAATTFAITIKNNAPGGGGNDWVMDDISLVQCLVVLPIQLVDFQGKPALSGVNLNWQATDEENLSYYEIQRSTDDHRYGVVGRVDANPSATISSYQYVDNTASLQQPVFYRLNMVNRDGKSILSKTIQISDPNLQKQAFYLSPNPAKNSTTLYATAEASGTAQITLWNLSGALVHSQMTAVTRGRNAILVQSLNPLPPGIYMVKTILDNKTSCSKLLVE